MNNAITVVGAGPAGLLSAISVRTHDIDVRVLEAKEIVGQTEHCSGLLSIEGLKQIGLSSLPDSIIQNKNIIGAKIYSPNAQELIVKKNKPHAYVVDRLRFDRYLADIAEKKGAEILTSSRVLNIKRKENNLLLKLGRKSKEQEISTKLAILAEGRFPKLNAQVNLSKPSHIIFASQIIVSGVKDLDPSFVELYQIQKYAPGFFAWIIPLNQEQAKVGLGTLYRPASSYLDKFMKSDIVKKRFSKIALIKSMSGAIPLGAYIKKTYTDNVMVVGDAAGQTKPTTGGGVIIGGIAAKIAGDVGAKAVEKNNFSSKVLKEYEKRWKKEFKINLFVMKHIRQYLDGLKDNELEKLFYLLNKNKIKNLFTEEGDVDNQMKIALRLLVLPDLMPFVVKTGFKYLIRKRKNVDY